MEKDKVEEIADEPIRVVVTAPKRAIVREPVANAGRDPHPVHRKAAGLLGRPRQVIRRDPPDEGGIVLAVVAPAFERKAKRPDPFDRVQVIRRVTTRSADRDARDRFGNRIWPETPKASPQ